jgi:alkylated DNA repair dioxygenase AlkB
MSNSVSVLPFDGESIYFGKVFSETDAQNLFDTLWNKIEWKNDEAYIFGKHFVTKRKVAWYADGGISYSYSNKTKDALSWTKHLHEIKTMVEALTGEVYNSCLLNLYHNGNEAMGWHSDNEKSLRQNGTIASLSFGAERFFKFRHKKMKALVHRVFLENGSLLVMKGETQLHWQHCLAKESRITAPRINLTFRQMNT